MIDEVDIGLCGAFPPRHGPEQIQFVDMVPFGDGTRNSRDLLHRGGAGDRIQSRAIPIDERLGSVPPQRARQHRRRNTHGIRHGFLRQAQCRTSVVKFSNRRHIQKISINAIATAIGFYVTSHGVRPNAHTHTPFRMPRYSVL